MTRLDWSPNLVRLASIGMLEKRLLCNRGLNMTMLMLVVISCPTIFRMDDDWRPLDFVPTVRRKTLIAFGWWVRTRRVMKLTCIVPELIIVPTRARGMLAQPVSSR